MDLKEMSWDLLEKVRLADFFEERNIPPIVFPIVLLLSLFLLSYFLLGASPEPIESTSQIDCGDGICDALSEDLISCPSDCATTPGKLKTLKIILKGDIKNSLNIILENQERELIRTLSGKKNEFIFTGVSDDAVLVTIRNPQNSETLSSEMQILNEVDNELIMQIPANFFEKEEAPKKATLRVLLKDSNTGANLAGRVTISSPNGASRTLIESKDINGAGYFTLDAGVWYVITSNVDDYAIYEDNNAFILEPDEERTYTANIEASQKNTLLTVCLKDGATSLDGTITAYDISNEIISSKSTVDGCLEFNIPTQTVSLSTGNLPENCLDVNRDLTLISSSQSINLNVYCGGNETSYARIKAINESGATVTQEASISMFYSDGTWIHGSGPSWTLDLGEGGYTEFIEIDPTQSIYFIITNLEGYATTTTDMYLVDIGENRSITITMRPPPPAVYNVTIVGVTYPQPLSINQEFTIAVSHILYGQMDVTESSELYATLAGEECSETCTSPLEPGTYDLALTALYEGIEGIKVIQLTVLDDGANYLFDLIPHANFDKETPIDLNFDIKFNGSLTDSLTDSDVTIYYVPGELHLDEKPELTNENTTFLMRVDTPFPGDHKAEIYLQKIVNGKLYEQNFTHYFEAEPSRVLIDSELSISPRILNPGENFGVYLRLIYDDKNIEYLENVFVTIDGIKTNIEWDEELNVYTEWFTSSSSEGIYTAIFEIEKQEVDSMNFYVIDTDKSKYSECEISACDNRPHVRKCVDKYKNENFYSEYDTIGCIEDGWAIPGVDIACLSSAGNRGDWDNSCTLSSKDSTIHSNALQRIPDQKEINEYSNCGDLDNDGDVDEEDQTCLNNLISTKWYGDLGDGTCTSQMNGGFCYDVTLTSVYKGDFDDSGHITAEDIEILQLIRNDASKGISVPKEFLDFADFDQDGSLTNKDKICLESFQGIDIQDMIQKVTKNINNMPDFDYNCLNIYNISCGGSQGDINSDGVINEIDLLVVGLIASDIGGLLTNSEGEDVAWQHEFSVTRGQTKNLPTAIPYNKDWIVEMTGNFDFSVMAEEDVYFFADPSFENVAFGGKFLLRGYTQGKLPGQTLDISPSFTFSYATDIYGPLMAVPVAYKGVPGFGDNALMITLKTEPSSGTIRIENYAEEKRVRIYWNEILVGHYAIEEERGNPLGWSVGSLHFQDSSGTFRYYVGDLDPYMTPFGSLECADFNEDGVIDETDFLCMSLMIFNMDAFIDEAVCESCTQQGLKEGWYYGYEICDDSFDNDCDSTIDIARGGSRVDYNWCECPNWEAPSGTWCVNWPYFDLDKGMRPGIEDGNYAVCMSQTWASTDVYGEPAPAFKPHLEHQTEAMNDECTPALNCHFYWCYDNFVLCSNWGGGGTWTTAGGGIRDAADANSGITSLRGDGDTNQQYEDQNGEWRMRPAQMSPGAPDAVVDTGTSASGSEDSNAPATTDTDGDGVEEFPTSGLDNDNYYISMDGIHYIGSECQTLTIDGETYKTYYGAWGGFMECEGKCPQGQVGTTADGQSVMCLANDGWDNNCYSGDAPNYKKDDDDCNSFRLGGWCVLG